jgi:hypothetical protein
MLIKKEKSKKNLGRISKDEKYNNWNGKFTSKILKQIWEGRRFSTLENSAKENSEPLK